MDTPDFTDLCRICLCIPHEGSKNVFMGRYSRSNDLKNNLGIEMEKFPYTPNIICNQCDNTITELKTFRKLVDKSEEKWNIYRNKVTETGGEAQRKELLRDLNMIPNWNPTPEKVDDTEPDQDLKKEVEKADKIDQIDFDDGIPNVEISKDDFHKVSQKSPSEENLEEESESDELSDSKSDKSDRDYTEDNAEAMDRDDDNDSQQSDSSGDFITSPSKRNKRTKKTSKSQNPNDQKVKRQRKHGKVICHICGCLVHKYSLKNHIAGNHQETEYCCEFCGKKFTKKGSYYAHRMKKHTLPAKSNGSVTCEKCGKVLSNVIVLKQHYKRVHDVNREREKCTVCNKFFLRLELHMKMHQDRAPQECPKCKNMFLSSLKEHMKKCGVDQKKHPCDICGKRYTTKGDMMEHRNFKHLGIRVPCLFCEYGGSDRRTTGKHMEEKHPKEYAQHREMKAQDVKSRIQLKYDNE